MKPLYVECPCCKARPGEECWETVGNGDFIAGWLYVETHAARIRAAEEAAKKEARNV